MPNIEKGDSRVFWCGVNISDMDSVKNGEAIMRANDEKVQGFRKLYEQFVVIPDAWDIVSAVILEQCGYKAISTTSAGLGLAVGCPVDDAISRNEMVRVVTGICRAVTVPVSVDLESGYSDTASGVEETTRAVIEAGVVAVAIEDSDGVPGKALRPAEEHAERIRAARRAAEKAKISLFINGRSDGFWINDDIPEEEKVREAIRRGNLYLAAGADGIFISGNKAFSPEIVRALVAGLRGPLNVLVYPNGPSISELGRLGVRRITLGSLPMRAQAGFLKHVISKVRETGDLSALSEYGIPMKDLNNLVRAFWQSR